MNLTVRRLAPHLAGNGLAALSTSILSELIIEPGDAVVLQSGSDRTVARCVHGHLENKSADVALDHLMRTVLGCDVGDVVTVEPVETVPARGVQLTTPPPVSIPDDIVEFLFEELQGRPLVKGMPFGVKLTGEILDEPTHVSVFVVDTDPSGPVMVTTNTDITFDQSGWVDEGASREGSQSGEKPGHSYSEIGGLSEELAEVRKVVEMPVRAPELFEWLGAEPPRGVLLYGPPGTGKTLLGKVLASETGSAFVHIIGSDVQSPHPGETERKLRELFNTARQRAPAIIFIDELDTIAPKRDGANLSPGDDKNVGQLLGLMDGVDTYEQVVVIGATNRIDSIDSALRRPGRFDYEVEIGPPSEVGRQEILDIHTRDMPLGPDVSLAAIAQQAHGFVGADIRALATEAALAAMERTDAISTLSVAIPPDRPEWLIVTAADFEIGLVRVTPSALREYEVERPQVSWTDVGGLSEVTDILQELVEWPQAYGQAYERLCIEPQSGVLLYGPPGTGKTHLARALASEAGVNFISIKGPELTTKWVGESARNLRQLFERARQNTPVLVFFDEIDSISRHRGGSSTQEYDQLLTQLLTELDGISPLQDVLVVAATNRLDAVDDALLRPGRFEYLLEIPLPDVKGRAEILEIHLADRPVAEDIDIGEISRQTDHESGAYLESLVREAALCALRDHVNSVGNKDQTTTSELADVAEIKIHHDHLSRALVVLEQRRRRCSERPTD